MSAVAQDEQILFRCATTFPFVLFPDLITVTSNQVIIQRGLFFMSKKVTPILFEDLVNVTVSTNPFFATAKFDLRFSDKNPPKVRYLAKADGLRLREVIMPLIKQQAQKSV